MGMKLPIGNSWDSILTTEFEKEYFQKLAVFLDAEYATKTIYPPLDHIFNAFKFTALDQVKVVIVGQDPYINEGEANGLAFSVGNTQNDEVNTSQAFCPNPQKIPPSLRNIFKEVSDDINAPMPTSGCLKSWANQGVLLLNSTLTVEAKKSRSHAGVGWERFTDYVLKQLCAINRPMVFMLWGRDAQSKLARLGINMNEKNHLFLTAAHPSPLARGKFFGCKHFSQANVFLQESGLEPIQWTCLA